MLGVAIFGNVCIAVCIAIYFKNLILLLAFQFLLLVLCNPKPESKAHDTIKEKIWHENQKSLILTFLGMMSNHISGQILSVQWDTCSFTAKNVNVSGSAFCRIRLTGTCFKPSESVGWTRATHLSDTIPTPASPTNCPMLFTVPTIVSFQRFSSHVRSHCNDSSSSSSSSSSMLYVCLLT
jgi:hypothetical protein